MILTCPACDTKYVVKDGAIPPAGRQVRCASCKHSWHQDPDVGADDGEAPPEAVPAQAPEIAAPTEVQSDVEFTGTPDPIDHNIASTPDDAPLPPPAPPGDDDRQWQPVPPAAAWDDATPDGVTGNISQGPADSSEEFEPFYDHEPIEQPRSKWPIVLMLVLLVALGAVAFWFLAPADLRARAGLATTSESQLDVVLSTGNYQRLASGNSLFTISGRIVNSTDSRQPVPSIQAELLDATKRQVIYSWTIPPPVANLDLNASVPFNNAEVDVPEGGKHLRVRLGGRA